MYDEFEKIAAAQIEVLEEFAKVAEELLIENGAPYDADDVVEVASALINDALDEEGEEEKVAELYNSGAIMAEGFLDSLDDEDDDEDYYDEEEDEEF